MFRRTCDNPFLGTSPGESSGWKVITILVTISFSQSENSKQSAKYSKKYQFYWFYWEFVILFWTIIAAHGSGKQISYVQKIV